jgi:hypothetical protein
MPPEVLERARKLAQISGKPMDDTTSLTGLDWTRQALGNLIENAKTAGDTQLARAYTGLQRDFVDGITKLSPEYGDALKVHAQMSAPINAMDTAQRIRDTSVDKLTGNLRPSSLANSMVDKTAQRATGFSGATLDNTLSNTDRNALAGLLSDVQRSTAATNSAGSAGSDTVKKLAYTNMLDQAGVPSMLRNARGGQIVGNLAGRAGQAIYGDANRQIANQLAEVMLNPGAAAELMRRATPSQRNALMGLLEHSGVPQIAVRSAPAIEASR